MSPADMERTMMAQARTADYLRGRCEGLKARLLAVSEECSKEYRRGYLAGRSAGARGEVLSLEEAESRRRRRAA